MERLRRAAPEQNTKILKACGQEWLPDRLKAQTEDMLNLVFQTFLGIILPKLRKGNVMRPLKRLAP